MSWEAIAAFVAIWITVLGSAVVITRKLSEIEIGLRKYTDEETDKTKAQLLLSIDHTRDDFGETVKSIRQHADDAHKRADQLQIEHQKLELYIRDNYVEVNSFEAALAKIDKTVDRIVNKLDEVIRRAQQE